MLWYLPICRIGRTGSFIVKSSLLHACHLLNGNPPLNTLAPAPQPSSSLPVLLLSTLLKELQEDLIIREIDSVREQRPGMVQRYEQIHLIYDILNQAFEGIRMVMKLVYNSRKLDDTSITVR
ncbi:hypothetical protein F4604DRAFT_1302571 [Suillus subluteus]|nr:hypothetical protein F4604DRAFT_1302571 [Suillus subluteus]